MGYQTDFSGELKFTSDLTGKALGHLKKFLGEDTRSHKEWKLPGADKDPDLFFYIELEFNDDFSGLKWDGSEKTYHMIEQVNFLTQEMKKVDPTFGFKGALMAQGEEPEDRWMLVIDKNGLAKSKTIKIKGERVTCPHCEEDFILNN